MVNVKVYVEGGGDTRELGTRCREGFSRFFRNVSFKNRMPRVVACGSRKDAYDSFATALDAASAGEFIVLLVDSEAPVEDTPWNHLKKRDGWERPGNAQDEHAHLMVECMESWFLADPNTLEKFFGQGFNNNALPTRVEKEKVAKADVFDGLKDATRLTKTKGKYDKGRHSYAILGLLDAGEVVAAMPHAYRLVATLKNKVGI